MKNKRDFYLDDSTYEILVKEYMQYQIRYGKKSWDEFFKWIEELASQVLTAI